MEHFYGSRTLYSYLSLLTVLLLPLQNNDAMLGIISTCQNIRHYCFQPSAAASIITEVGHHHSLHYHNYIILMIFVTVIITNKQQSSLATVQQYCYYQCHQQLKMNFIVFFNIMIMNFIFGNTITCILHIFVVTSQSFRIIIATIAITPMSPQQ